MARQGMDITNQRFGKLTAIKISRSNNGKWWLLKCDCGKYVERKATSLRWCAKKYSGEFVSCGCAHNFFKHGLCRTRIYRIYAGIKKRCFSKSCESYHNYGGRGITLCKEWNDDFVKFYKWALSHGYKKDLTIERKDVNGNYCPDNCSWIPKSKQSMNTRISRLLTYKGKTQTLSEWSRDMNIRRSTIFIRLKKGWPVDKALSIPAVVGRNIAP